MVQDPDAGGGEMKESFEEWLNTIRRSDLFTESERTLLERAWNHQKSKINALEKRIKELEWKKSNYDYL